MITRRLMERIFLVGIAVVTIILMAAAFHFQRQVNRQRTMFYQLQLLRTSIQLYKAVRHQNPRSLEQLVTEEYQFPGDSDAHHFLHYVPLDTNGKISDPFGNAYLYDAPSGWVRSRTSGYQFW